MKDRRQSLFQTNRVFVSPYLFLFLVLAFSCILGGCASTIEMATAFTPVPFESSKAVVYVYRKSRFVGAANTAEIFINNQYAGQLVNGSYCAQVTEPGRVEIKTLEKIPAVFVLAHVISELMGEQPLVEFTADPGQEYFLEFNVAGYKVRRVSKEEALSIMQELEPAKVRAGEQAAQTK